MSTDWFESLCMQALLENNKMQKNEFHIRGWTTQSINRDLLVRDSTKGGAIVSRRARPREVKGCSVVVDVLFVDGLPSGLAAGATTFICSSNKSSVARREYIFDGIAGQRFRASNEQNIRTN